jgi:hypothetical protein
MRRRAALFPLVTQKKVVQSFRNTLIHADGDGQYILVKPPQSFDVRGSLSTQNLQLRRLSKENKALRN